MLYIIFLLFLVHEVPPGFSGASYEEKALVYEMFRGTEKIGTVIAVRVTDGIKDVYRIETHVQEKMIFNVKVDIVVRNTFINGVLKEAAVKGEVNGNVRIDNYILQQPARYRMIDKDQDTSFYNKLISDCVSELYFTEPEQLSSVFSETFLQQVPISKNAPGSYQLSMPDGRSNYYRYENGVCTGATIETQISTVHLKLVPASTD